MAVAVVPLLLAACAGTPIDRLLTENDYQQRIAAPGMFRHQLFLGASGEASYLHIYIEGDGRPWYTARHIARDPTPRHALMLELMTLDSAPTAYLGRPCYFRTGDPLCEPRWWTDGRYSTEVVGSMNQVIDQLAKGYRGVVLLGYSGGGALAMLLAGRRTDVAMVVTVAGNLDVRAWTELHGYTPLDGSLDPIDMAPLPQRVKQLHLAGAEDENIPAPLIEAALEKQSGPELWVVAGADHSCCWSSQWPEVLRSVEQALPARAGTGI